MRSKKSLPKLALVTSPRLSSPSLPKAPSLMSDLSDLEQKEFIGKGNDGEVFRALHRPSGLWIALKKVPVLDNEERRRNITREVKNLYKCKSSFVVGSYGAYISQGYFHLSMEFMDKGTVKDALAGGRVIPEAVIRHIAFQVLSGLECLHSNKVIHRDIKPSNLLLSSQGLVKISDFGVSGELDYSNATCDSFVGTVLYMSPERIRGDGYRPDTDIWSLGVTLLECALGRHPYHEYLENLSTLGFFNVVSCPNEDPVSRVPDTATQLFKDFIAICLNKTSGNRSTPEQLLDHSFISKDPTAFNQWLETI